MLTAEQVIDASVVDRVGCPVCHQRRWVCLDCHCCGGLGYVDCDNVFDVVSETLADCCFMSNRPAPDWVVVGFYAVVGGAFIVLDNRSVDFVTDDQMTHAYRVADSRKRSLFARFVSWLMPSRGAA